MGRRTDILEDIQRFQKTFQYTRSKVDHMIREFMYMLLSDMNLRIGKIKNYNNKILVSSSSFKIETNLKINLDDDKHIEKGKPGVKPDKPDIESKNEDKQNIKMIKTKPDIESKIEDRQDIAMMNTKSDMNEITHEAEKGSLEIRNNSYLYSMVDIQMIYFLLVFVIKYVYIKLQHRL